MRIDLHTHTTASDGLLSPEQLVDMARNAGVHVLAICDHDSTDGVDAAVAAGMRLGVEVIPAVEINTDVDQGEVHVLGYFIDHREAWLQEFLRKLRNGRLHRAERMVEKLNALGIEVDFARVRALAQGAVGRPHVAWAMVEAGAVKSVEEAFDRYIGRSGPAYVERMKVTPEEAVQVILRAGGIPVLAHPGWGVQDAMIASLVDAGLEGIEAYYPEHTPAMQAHYLALAKQHNLLVTGGTDFHGTNLATKTPIGGQFVPAEVIDKLKERHLKKKPAVGRYP
ncbi:MAG: PHP domain-containing protein [Armatimonadetes bacterium]|nr:PHP domain-containing protein [Armatimonadota bacterium]